MADPIKISDLTALGTAPTNTAIIPLTVDPSGTPLTRTVTGAQLAEMINGEPADLLTINEGGSTASPAAGKVKMYAKADGLLYSKDDAGVETQVSGGGSPLTTKGDVYVYGAADDRLPVGTDTHVLTADSAQALGVKWAAPAASGSSINNTQNGRLTLESAVPVSSADQANKTTLYFALYQGNQASVYTGAAWETFTFAELSLNMAAYTASKNYDIWLYSNAGTLTLDSTVWTNDTTRATALALQDGIYVKNGDATRKYIGTVRIDAAQKCQDTVLKRYVWNYYNRVERTVWVGEGTDSWTYATSTWRSANNSTANRVEAIIGVADSNISLLVSCTSDATSATNRGVGIGVDVTNANSCQLSIPGYSNGAAFTSYYKAIPTAGFHFYQWIEWATTGTTVTFFGDLGSVWKTGLIGEVLG